MVQLEQQQEQFLRDMEIAPDKYYPEDARRDLTLTWPDEGFSFDLNAVNNARGDNKENK